MLFQTSNVNFDANSVTSCLVQHDLIVIKGKKAELAFDASLTVTRGVCAMWTTAEAATDTLWHVFLLSICQLQRRMNVLDILHWLHYVFWKSTFAWKFKWFYKRSALSKRPALKKGVRLRRRALDGVRSKGRTLQKACDWKGVRLKGRAFEKARATKGVRLKKSLRSHLDQ